MKEGMEESDMTTTDNTVAKTTMIERIATLLHSLMAVSKGKGKAKVNLGRWDATGAYPNPIYDEKVADTMLTPKQAVATLARFCKTTIGTGWAPASSLTPSTHGMKLTHTLTSGKNKGNEVNVFAYGLTKARREDKRAIKSAKREVDLAKAQADGGAWFAEGVTDKEGAGRACVSEKKARKLWCAQVCNFGADWWNTDKDTKATRLGLAIVYRGTYVKVDGDTTITSDTAMSTDDAIIAAARQLGSKASTVKGAKTFMAKFLS